MNRKSIYFKFLAMLLCAAFLFGCTTDSTQSGTDSQLTGTEQSSSNNVEIEGIVADASTVVTYDENDYYSDWKNDNPNYIEMMGSGANITGSGAEAEDGNITITAAGIYVLSGKLDNGQIAVDVENKGTVRLILNGAEINCTDSAAIYVSNAGKTIITLAEGTENYISDGVEYIFPNASTDEPNAAIFSKDSLTINGNGTLIVHGNYNNGITSKDELKVTGGNIQIYSQDDGLMGRDMVAVKAGNISIEAGGDGIKSTNDTDTAKGFIAIEGGSFAIKSGDDGIHADTSIAISGGEISITKSYEGIESNLISVTGGDIHVTASDDGINVSGGNDQSAMNGRPGQNNFSASSDNKLNISGGYVVVDAAGDGLDANGSIYMSGGTVLVNGPTSSGNGAVDYDGVFEITGGFLAAAGSSGMAQAASEQSTQYSVLMSFSQIQQAGTPVYITNSEGNTVAAFTPQKSYQSVLISSPELKKDSTYTVYSGGTSTGTGTDGLYSKGEIKGGTKVVEFTIADVVTWLTESGVTTGGSRNMGGPGNPPGFGEGRKDMKQQ